MAWNVEFHEEFDAEYKKHPTEVQDELLAKAFLLQKFGPQLGRPHVDTLSHSKHANMKELRFNADNGVWRVAFAFDHQRKAILLTAGDKKGKNESAFYKDLISKADVRLDNHNELLSKKDKKHGHSDSKGAKGASKKAPTKSKGKGR